MLVSPKNHVGQKMQQRGDVQGTLLQYSFCILELGSHEKSQILLRESNGATSAVN